MFKNKRAKSIAAIGYVIAFIILSIFSTVLSHPTHSYARINKNLTNPINSRRRNRHIFFYGEIEIYLMVSNRSICFKEYVIRFKIVIPTFGKVSTNAITFSFD